MTAIVLPSKNIYLKEYKHNWFRIKDSVYDNSTHINNSITLIDENNNLLLSIMYALYYSGDRNFIPKYNNLPRNDNDLIEFLQKANVTTIFLNIKTATIITKIQIYSLIDISVFLKKNIQTEIQKRIKHYKSYHDFDYFFTDEENENYKKKHISLVKFYKRYFS